MQCLPIWPNWFHIDVTFEMRKVLYKICLINDNVYKHRLRIYMKQKEGERERDSGETERENVCVCEGG
jgi:hypothetical protein